MNRWLPKTTKGKVETISNVTLYDGSDVQADIALLELAKQFLFQMNLRFKIVQMKMMVQKTIIGHLRLLKVSGQHID